MIIALTGLPNSGKTAIEHSWSNNNEETKSS